MREISFFNKKKMRVVGVLSGTSVDGIDVAVVDIEDEACHVDSAILAQDFTYRLDLKCFECVEWDPAIKKRVLDAMNSTQLSAQDFCEIHVQIGQEFARAILETLTKHGISTSEIDLIGSHGQTIWHQVGRGESIRGTLQMGESTEIANAVGVDVVDQFRVMDVAMGGQGAPLTSIYDYLTVKRDQECIVIVNNIGGMSNATILPPIHEVDAESKLMSFDTGPGSIMIDEAIVYMSNGQKRFDENGDQASKGVCCRELLLEIMDNPYFNEPIPKTTGREQFGTKHVHHWIQRAREVYRLSDEDILCTLTHVTSRSIIVSYQQALSLKYGSNAPDISSITITGGGAHNSYLLKILQSEARSVFNNDSIVVREADDSTGFVDAKEGMLFALLAYLFTKRRNGNIRQVTGSSHNAVLGKLTPYQQL